MTTYKFNNGETRLESQMRDNDFKISCILWGCFNKETGEPLPYTTSETTEEDIKEEEKRLSKIRNEHEEAMYDDSDDFYICPNTGYMMDLEGNVIDDNDQNEYLKG